MMDDMRTSLDGEVELKIKVRRIRGVRQLELTAEIFPFFDLNRAQRQSVSLKSIIDRNGPSLGLAVMYRLLHTLDYEVSKKWAEPIPPKEA